MMTAEKRDVLAYLKTTNRPYSANDVMLNINKGYGKTAVQRALDQLVEDGAIKEKIYGKQKVYSALQNQNEDAAEIQKELGDIDHKIAEMSEYLKSKDQTLKTVEKEYNEIQSVLTTEQAELKESELKETVKTLQNKLSALAENKTHISEEDKTVILTQHENIMKEYRKRKRICMDILNAILEGYPKNKEALFEEIGLELDEPQNTPNC